MINEEILKKAAIEADQAIRDSLPAPEECKHIFSPEFHKKMRLAHCNEIGLNCKNRVQSLCEEEGIL